MSPGPPSFGPGELSKVIVMVIIMLELVIPIIGMEMEILIMAMDGGEDSDADDDDGNLGVSPPEAAPPVGLLAPLDHLQTMMVRTSWH